MIQATNGLENRTGQRLVGRGPLALRLHDAKFSFNTRRIPVDVHAKLLTDATPSPGDIALARIDNVGQHPRIQLPSGRRSELYPGDEIVVCYADRYAVNQWEAIVPPTLEPCDLVAAGGVLGRVRSRHSRTKRPTRVTPIGLLADESGEPINVRSFALEPREGLPANCPPVVAVVGTGMDAGKTTAAASLIRGLALGSVRAAAIKVTGTGACGDYFKYVDAGAHCVADFVDAGFVSTYRVGITDLERVFATLVGHARDEGAEIVIAEIADGLAQEETEALLGSEMFRGAVTGVLLAAADALGAAAACTWLTQRDLPVHSISGMVSASHLAAQETEFLTRIPVMGIKDLTAPKRLSEWVPVAG